MSKDKAAKKDTANAAAATTEKAPKAPKVLSAEAQKAEKYPGLSATFFRGKFKGQLDSAVKSHSSNAAKSADFIKAVQAGDIAWPETALTKKQQENLVVLGMSIDAIPENLRYVAPEKPAKADKAEEGSETASAGADDSAAAAAADDHDAYS